ncbi:MAG: hypothetical protein NVS2B9_11990 [Myxococcales bacterium]
MTPTTWYALRATAFASLSAAPFVSLAAAAAPPSSDAGAGSATSRTATGARSPAAATPPCPEGKLHLPRIAAGESFRYRLDLLGADVGTFEIAIESPPAADRDRASFLLRSRARTNAFVSNNMGRYEAFSESLLGPGFAPLRYREEVDEGDKHRSQSVEFPARGDKLEVHATQDGKPDPVSLGASAAARDMLSTWLVVRGTSLAVGSPFCAEVYAGRKMWRVSGSAAAREQIDTPLGTLHTVRIDTVAVRVDDPKVVRNGHFWLTDDARRLPVVAIADFKGKAVRAQLDQVTGLNVPPAPRKTLRETKRAESGSAAIGRR